MSFVQALQQDVLLGDGANGTCLAAMGFKNQPYDLANILAPELVRAVHAQYFDAGADFVETNTYAANRFRLEGLNVDPRAINLAGAKLAREAAGSRLVLGAIGPAGKPLEPIGHIRAEEWFKAVAEQAEALAEGGVDGIMLETFIDMEELTLAVNAVKSVTDLPIVVSKAYIEDGEMLAEGLPVRTAKDMADLHVVALGANCIVGPQRMLDLVRQIAETTELPIIAFPTPGLPQLVKGQIIYDQRPEYFAKATMRLVEEGAKIVGGCCGTTPDHIREIRKLVGKGVKTKARTGLSITTKERAPLPETEPSELAQKIGQKFITAVELDVPRGLNLDKLLASCKAMKIAGADVINISDGARARLRCNPAAVCSLIQRQVGIETTMHFACRDRNLLAMQADLLGCHAVGVRNILAVTGDPANIGDYPSATSVFDIDAIGLIRILNRFNEGIDLAGYSVGVKCGFTICAAYNPMAQDQELEDDRLRRKVEAGATVVYTQPVFEMSGADRTVKICNELGVAGLLGLLPLRSERHAEFMHNEVPGIEIPDWLRKKIADAPDDASALAIGVEEASNLARAVKSGVQGIYLMPPFGSAKIAAAVMQALN